MRIGFVILKVVIVVPLWLDLNCSSENYTMKGQPINGLGLSVERGCFFCQGNLAFLWVTKDFDVVRLLRHFLVYLHRNKVNLQFCLNG